MSAAAPATRRSPAGLDTLLTQLRAAAEATRLRILAVLDGSELTVTELTQVLNQSQPRISRHLKILGEAGLLGRFQEGSWAFYRIADKGPGADAARAVLEGLDRDDAVIARDRERLQQIRRARADEASRYFAEIAADWDRVRSLHVPESEVEQAMLEAAGEAEIGDLLDVGTGTGRILQVFAERIERGLGIDTSREMLAIARSRLEELGLRHCQVRHGDIFDLDVEPGSMDLVTIHHVLHFFDDPAAAIREAGSKLRAGGRLLIVDFAPHDIEYLRSDFAHRRLGFGDDEMRRWCREAGIRELNVRHLQGRGDGEREQLVVSLWTGTRQRAALARSRQAVA